jgi:YfiH family protein
MTSPTLLDMQWHLPPGVHAACTTRLGGVSLPPWDSFNLAMHVGDDPAHVAANRARLQELKGFPAEPVWLNQVHGIDVVNLDATHEFAAPPAADASVTSKEKVACVVMVADCLPVLFCTRDGTRVGAAHAGWRGLAAGVLERTIAAMGVSPSRLHVWLGPAISPDYFEVGDEVREAFLRWSADSAACFELNTRGRWQADLVGLATRRLNMMGVTDITGGQWCTFADRKRFFSHRRDGRSGRLAALIWRGAQ